MFKEIFLDAPNIGTVEKEYLNRAIDSGYVSTVGPFVTDFEQKCAEYLKASKAVSTMNGTSALHISLHELGIGAGDEVIVPALTFIATINPVMYVGATPVIVDVDPETWNIYPPAIEEAITERTKAIMPVHLYGNPCDMDEINSIAKKYNLYVIEDAAESLGAIYKGSYTGTLGDLGCLSFNGNKSVTTGGGGMIVGNDPERLDHIKFLVNQAKEPHKDFEIYHSQVGFNYRMTNLQAAMGLAQFARLDELLGKKQEIYALYRNVLKECSEDCFQKEYPSCVSANWFTAILVGSDSVRRKLQLELKERGIPTRRIFTPLNLLPPYKDYRYVDYGNARRIYEKGICLPSSTLNKIESIHYVCNILKDFLYKESTVQVIKENR